jgi:metal-sulfur cluster biosynthetic enzyme
MNTPEAQAILEPAATRVRDPASGKSVWLAGLIKDSKLEGDRLELTLAFTTAHTSDDQDRMTEALRRNLEGIGWKGDVRIHRTLTRVAPPLPPAPRGAAEAEGTRSAA